ncbi:MAG: hypothetical protein EP334_10185 [Gammaproteobacteria bacterium]|nr:MAG: hypothetical protein EP334_10185 [Gammaproteobacteria bacterium]
MGHDIYGFDSGNPDEANEVSYLRRGAFGDAAREIYKALGAENHDCGCSGCGGDPVFFSKDQLVAARDKLPAGDDMAPERSFLDDCIASGDGVWVAFW